MASGFFAILDDLTALMDDVALASKVATKKTAGILGDDLAVNADKATGFLASREIPVLWAITKGSFLNKLIIVPIALLLNYFLPVAIKVVLVLGGLYLAYEGVEKVLHFIFHRKKDAPEELQEVMMEDESEKDKIRAAVSTDFILSVEIVIIALGSVLGEPLSVQIVTVCIVSVLATIGVYGIVALIVRMDDAGFRLQQKFGENSLIGKLGNVLIQALPIIIRILGVVGTVALILVAGGIFMHNIPGLHLLPDSFPDILQETIYGVIGGLAATVLMYIFEKIRRLFKLKKA